MSYDIRDVLRSVQDGAPAPRTTTDDIIARARRRRARRTAAASAAGVAACLGVVLAAVSLPGGPGGTAAAGQPAASAPAGPAASDKPLPVKRVDFAGTLGGYRAGPYQVGPVGQVTAGYQEIPVYRDGETWTDDANHADYPYAGAVITVYAPGVYDPGSFAFGDDSTLTVGPKYAVRVGDRPALAVDFTYRQPDQRGNAFVRTALAWQYRNGAWATLVPQYQHAALPRADAVRIAEGLVTTAGKQQLKVPYEFDGLPAGWQAVGITQTGWPTGGTASVVVLHRGPIANPAARVDESLPGTVTIGVSRGKPKGPLHEGLNCAAGRHECTILHGDYLIGVASWDVPDATVQQIAESLRFTDFADQGAWLVPNA